MSGKTFPKTFRYYCCDRDTGTVFGTANVNIAKQYIERFDYTVIDMATQRVLLPDGQTDCIYQSVNESVNTAPNQPEEPERCYTSTKSLISSLE